MKCELRNNDCVDLPSLTKIHCYEGCESVHKNMGHIVLESMNRLYLKDYFLLDIPNLEIENVQFGDKSLLNAVDIKAKSKTNICFNNKFRCT